MPGLDRLSPGVHLWTWAFWGAIPESLVAGRTEYRSRGVQRTRASLLQTVVICQLWGMINSYLIQWVFIAVVAVLFIQLRITAAVLQPPQVTVMKLPTMEAMLRHLVWVKATAPLVIIPKMTRSRAVGFSPDQFLCGWYSPRHIETCTIKSMHWYREYFSWPRRGTQPNISVTTLLFALLCCFWIMISMRNHYKLNFLQRYQREWGSEPWHRAHMFLCEMALGVF